MARKCTLSADSLLLHPDITSESRVSDFRKRCAEEPMGRTRSSHHRHHLQPESAIQGKMMSSLSSDQIHSHLTTSGPIDGTRSASPKLAVKKGTPEPIEEPQASTSQAGPSSDEKRKGSVASQVFSRPGRLARLLRRTHSAGCSKDVPPYAIFLREKAPVSLAELLICPGLEFDVWLLLQRGVRPKESTSGSEKRRSRKQAS